MVYQHSRILCICIASVCLSFTECISSNVPDEGPEGTSSSDASTTVISSLAEGSTVDNKDSVDPKCQDSDKLEVHGNPENCGEYFLFCVRPVSEEIASQTQTVFSRPPSQIKEQYDVRKRSCQRGHLFDGIEKQCISNLSASCNETYETICQNTTTFHKDPVQASAFIECLINGTAKRTQCQPLGTIFNEESQTCVRQLSYPPTNPPAKINSSESELFSFALLRIVVSLISRTNDKFSPWMERVSIRRNEDLNENSSDIDDNDEILANNAGSNLANETQKILHTRRNFSDTEFDKDEAENEDEVLVLTNDTFKLFLYYGVIAGWPICMFLCWFAIAYICWKMCECCEYVEDDDEDDFFKYNPYDKYIMTRM